MARERDNRSRNNDRIILSNSKPDLAVALGVVFVYFFRKYSTGSRVSDPFDQKGGRSN